MMWPRGRDAVAELLRTSDFRSSPLGETTGWAPCLKAVVQTALASELPMAIAWGPEFAHIYNDAYAPLVGDRHPAVLGRPAAETRPDAWMANAPIFARVLAGRAVTMRDPVAPYTFWHSPLRDDGGAVAGLLSIGYSSTEGAATERRYLVAAEEKERRRLSWQLQEATAQPLAALGLRLQALADTSPDLELRRGTRELQKLMDSLGRQLFAIALELRPRALDDFGLEAALASYVAAWSRRSRITVEVHATGGGQRLPPLIEGALYRILQEALTNVASHSGAQLASVVLDRRDGHVVLIVEDDGRGFDPALGSLLAVDGASSALVGLAGIAERTALLDGTFEIESSPGAGTTLYVRVPLANETLG